ncbi:MAG TPA: delta-60 repeat domain-containing protein [Tepidisphaeraceae bacterium]|nr:delta-60 repeat domain-containing protein [Tepidisphaeraceae bacterium]
MSSFRRTTRTVCRPGQVRTRRAAVEPLERRTLLSAGDLDPTFSGDGKVLAEDVRVDRAATDVAVLADGKVLVVGYRSTGRVGRLGSDLELTRYNADGTLDKSFGDGGRVRTDLGDLDFARVVVAG